MGPTRLPVLFWNLLVRMFVHLEEQMITIRFRLKNINRLNSSVPHLWPGILHSLTMLLFGLILLSYFQVVWVEIALVHWPGPVELDRSLIKKYFE